MFHFCIYSNDLTISSNTFMGPKFNPSAVKTPFSFARHGALNKEEKKVTLRCQIEPWMHKRKKKSPVCFVIKSQAVVSPLQPRLTFYRFPQQSLYSHYFLCCNCSSISGLYHPGSIQHSSYLQFIILEQSFPMKILYKKSLHSILCTLIRSIHISDTRDCSSVKIYYCHFTSLSHSRAQNTLK